LTSKPTYGKEEKKLVYDVLLLVTKYLHDAGISCILDATFNKEALRKQIKKKLAVKQNQNV
jgi:predicted kinase